MRLSHGVRSDRLVTSTVATVRWMSNALREPYRSVAEVAPRGEHHRDAGLVAGLHDVGVAARAARLDDRLDARLDRRLGAVGEREERVRRHHGAGEVDVGVAGLVDGDADGVHPA